MSLQTTTWQTVGPFFQIGLESLYERDIAGEGARGERITVEGRVLDGDGIPVPDAVVEVWQANSEGKYAHPEDKQDKPLEAGFRGFGRIPTDDEGRFRFAAVRPGSVPGVNGPQAPHFVIGLLMRGLLKGLVTRAYFPADPLHATDPVLAAIEPGRQGTLIMQSSTEVDGRFLWTIRMQGADETVFLDF